MSLVSKVQQIVEEFTISDELLNAAVDHFIWATEHGLRHHTDLGMPMIPSFVTSVPTGKEKGTFLAVDLGGTNFRVCSVELNGDSTYDLIQSKHPVPHDYMVGKTEEFFGYLADKIEEFLKVHHEGHFAQEDVEKKIFKMGFTFSFPVDQTALNRGTLIRWTKGYDIKDAVGQDVVLLLQEQINKRKLPIHVAALVNDTVGTLMTRSYTKPEGSENSTTLIGCIFGTGTNGAYSEKIKTIAKFDLTQNPEMINEKLMVINTEWGSFDNRLKVIPNNRFDDQLNKLTPNPGYHMFEKRISGMFLGELLRLVLIEVQNDIFTGGGVSDNSTNTNLNTPWSLDSSIPALIDADDSKDLTKTQQMVKSVLGFDTTIEQRQAIQQLSKAIGKRSAYLSAVPIAGLVLHTKALEKFSQDIDVGADGSVVEFYPNFEQMIRVALRKTKIGDQEKRIKIGLAKDGSGVGAALCALVA